MKNNKVEISIPTNFETILKQLYGCANYHGSSGHHNYIWLRKIYTKIINSIKRSIILNLTELDNYHKNRLIKHCDDTMLGIKKTTNINRININIIGFYTKLTFQLLGDLPDNWNNIKTANNSCWKFDKHRKIIYLSNNEQKTFIILDSFKDYAKELSPISEDELWNKLNYEFLNNYNKFIEWFKIEFPLVYIKLF